MAYAGEYTTITLKSSFRQFCTFRCSCIGEDSAAMPAPINRSFWPTKIFPRITKLLRCSSMRVPIVCHPSVRSREASCMYVYMYVYTYIAEVLIDACADCVPAISQV